MLLPTGYYLLGGAIAVALSFVVLFFVDPRSLDRLARVRATVFRPPVDGKLVSSSVSFLVLAGLVAAGFQGSRDPLSNPLPLVVWTVLWVGIVLLQGVAGNLWRWINPWYGPWRLFVLAAGRGTDRWLDYPKALSLWPAFVGLSLLAWFELIYPAPDDPARLAAVVAVYWAATFVLMVLFGFDRWSRDGEFLTVFMGMISRIGMLATQRLPGSAELRLNLPGARLADQPSLPIAGTAFLLLALASVSFDGLMRTFVWLGLVGINPLEFPGRSAVMKANTVGLWTTFCVLGAVFLLAVAAGERLAGRRASALEAAGALVWSIMPIALAYHFSHYLTSLLVNGQYALSAISDPFANGLNLFGTARHHVSAGAVLGAESAWVIWNLQATAIIAGHVLAVVSAHLIAWRRHGSARLATISQLPLAVLMVAYTVFGLWLLSTPTGY
ncbi:hypothetical protein ABGN05_15425 [Aquibium sp. LZ166]|uniref:Fenitrothion hydrolase n=2 Tax=Aquibium pacificus TaxID=3153579 RepID=A0ABV3SJV7_9HYPH